MDLLSINMSKFAYCSVISLYLGGCLGAARCKINFFFGPEMECSIKEDVIEVPFEVIHHRCHSLTQKSRNFLQSMWSFKFRLCQREIVFTVSTTQKHTMIQLHSPYRLLWFLISSQSGLIWIQTDIPLFSSRTTAASWVTSQLTSPWLEKEFSPPSSAL